MTEAADSLLRNDSLRHVAEQLFLQGAYFAPAEGVDTLQNTILPVTSADLFGAGSVLAVNTSPVPAILFLTENPLFQCLVLLLTALYALLTYHHAGDIYALFSRSGFDSMGVSDARTGFSHSHFLNLTGMIGLLLSGVLGVKYIGLLLPSGIIPYQAAAGVSLIVTSVLLLVIAVQTGMLYLIGTTTRCMNFIRDLNYIRRKTLAITAITTGPILLLYVLVPEGTGQGWVYILLAEIILITIFFLRKTLKLFISKKISILHWFLYLCIVEVFPISFLWLLITRQ